ncbi:MAG: hypothetical protein HYU36_24935 [Planctomycetes bacterium]|nr:hypothetical protein [Planctomycetota bacterium]
MPFRARILVLLLLSGGSAGAETLVEWTLREHLGHTWTRELVFFPLPKTARPQKACRVVDDTGNVLPAQVEARPSPEGESYAVGFLVNLAPYQTRRMRLLPGKAQPSDLGVEKSREAWVIGNSRCAVRVPAPGRVRPGTPFDRLPAPILAFRTPSGRWVGEGTLTGKQPVLRWDAELLASGPVWTDASVRYQFGDRKFYQVDVRVVSGENVVLVSETSQLSQKEFDDFRWVKGPDLLPGPGLKSELAGWLRWPNHMGWQAVVTDFAAYPTFDFAFMKGWADRAWDYRGKKFLEKPATPNPDPRLGLLLCPYQSIGQRTRAIGFCKEGQPEVAGLFYRHLSRWTHRAHNPVPLAWTDDGIVGRFVAFEARREWGWMADSVPSPFSAYAEHGGSRPGVLDAATVKWGETPLDKVKDWVLEWADPPGVPPHPRVVLTPEKLQELKASRGDDPTLGALFKPEEQRAAFESARAELGAVVRTFLTCGSCTPDTMIHRCQEIVRHEMLRLDLALALPDLTEEERKRARALAAFCAYKQADPDYWPCREYGHGPSNPNMMDISINVLACASGLLHGHPEWRQWGSLAARAARASILASVSEDGAWFESPGYQGAGNAPENLTLLILRRHGIDDLTDMPHLARAGSYFAHLLSPPDPRFNNCRTPASLGDNVPFGSNYHPWIAGAIQNKYPAEAGHAVWCWEQMGKPMNQPLLFASCFDPSVKSVPIDGRTKYFPGFGVIFRHGFGTPSETFMTLRWTDHAFGHYDEDIGSFNLYAKGVPLCLDWIDYSPGQAEYHNTLSPSPGWGDTRLAEFASLPGADYTRGRQPVRVEKPQDGDWQRQVLFVKDERDPGLATYLVVRDLFLSREKNSCNVWTMASEPPRIEGDRVAHLTGQFGVDAHVTFFVKPPGPLATLRYDHTGHSYGEWKQTQHRVQAAAESASEYGFLLYPARRDEPVASVVEEKDGVLHLQLPDQEHLIFLYPAEREAQVGPLRFKGTCGVAKKLGDRWSLTLLSGSLLARDGGQALTQAPAQAEEGH